MIGLLGRKKGMSALYSDDGRYTPVTVLEVGPCPVVQVKTGDTDGYESVQVAFDPVKVKNETRPRLGHFKRARVKPHRLLREFRGFEGEVKVGEVLKADLFKPGDIVTVTGVSKGRGFSGVIKRHGFSMPNQTHGTHEAFRGAGSIGAASYPARIWPGKKMAGRMGGETVTVKNLQVMEVDAEQGLLIVRGAVPGPAGGYIRVQKNK